MKTRNVVLTTVLAGVALPLCGCEPYQSAPERCKAFDTDVMYHIEKNPSKYIGELYAFEGRVIQAQESDYGIVFQMLTEIGHYAGPSLIVSFDRSDTPIVENSGVTVLGWIGPPIEGRNAFGARVSSLTIDAIAVRDGWGRGTCYFKGGPADREIWDQWWSGQLFSSCDRSRPKVPEKTDQNKDTPK